jgi:hypothetical protein
MKQIHLILFAFLLANTAYSQKEPAKKTPVQPKAKSEGSKMIGISDKEKKGGNDMKAWIMYMTPGPMHKMLERYNGDWKEEITFWMSPGAEATTSIASCSNKMIMDGRYQESRHTSEMNGMPFEGLGYLGYDNAKKVFVSTWMDNMGTGIMNMEGPWDEKSKTMRLQGKAVDPMTGKEKQVREEFTIIDDDHQLMEMYTLENGKEFKNMEIKFTR